MKFSIGDKRIELIFGRTFYGYLQKDQAKEFELQLYRFESFSISLYSPSDQIELNLNLPF